MYSNSSNDDPRRLSIDKDDLLEVAAEYLNHPEVRTDRFDRILLDTIAFGELSALGSDMRNYLILATLNGAVKLLTVYLALPALAYVLYLKEDGTLPIAVVVGWLIVAVLHLLGAPFRRRDLKRARAILRQVHDLHAILEDRSVSPKKFSVSLANASAAGMALDGSLFALVNRMTASDAKAAFMPRELGMAAPVT